MKKIGSMLSILLTLILVIFVGYYVYNEFFDKEEINPNELKLREYSNQVKDVINNNDYAFETTLVDNDWLKQKINSDVICQEVYYSNENEVLLHRCSISNNEEIYYFYDNIYLEENEEYKNIYNKVKNETITIEKGNLLSDLAVTNSNLGINEIDSCVNEGICQAGTAFAIAVNDTTVYRFYVLSDDGEKVELIMDNNLAFDDVKWTEENYNSSGPISVLEVLQEITDSWTNIPLRTYKVLDDNEEKVYFDIHIKTRAIIPSYTKIKEVDDNILEWLYGDSYWLSSARKGSSFDAWVVTSNGTFDTADVSSENIGTRPMIMLYKN